MKGLFARRPVMPLAVAVCVVAALAGCRGGGDDTEVVELSCEAGFSFESVLTADYEILHPSVAVAPNGQIWIAFVDLGTVSVSVARGRRGEEFTVESVETISTPVAPPLITIDSHNVPHIVFRSESTDSVRHARREGGNWRVADIPESGSGSNPSIDVDSGDTVYASFFRDGALRVAVWDGGSWDVETVRSFTGSGFAISSVRVGSDDVARISFFDLDTLALAYAVRSGSSWEVETVEEGPTELISVGGFNALALNVNDEPRIAYSFVESIEIFSGGG